MDTRNNMIIANGEFVTKDIIFCKKNVQTRKYDIKFSSGKEYHYGYSSVLWLYNPEVLNHKLYHIVHNGRELFNINAIYVFKDKTNCRQYWHICFEDNSERDYREDELQIETSCLKVSFANNVFEYFKQIATVNKVKSDEGTGLLKEQYKKIGFISKETVLAAYLNPHDNWRKDSKDAFIPIFPFGSNQSQYQAVKRAMDYQISVIQGPPGTGKTQTILNIIANILMVGKTALIVSNNNSAIENIIQKLALPEYNISFLVSFLGKAENKKLFIANQSGKYPDLSDWQINDERITLKDVKNISAQLESVFAKQEKLALLKQELSELKLELKYFEQYFDVIHGQKKKVIIHKNINSKKIMELWQECQCLSDQEKKIGFLFKIRSMLLYGIYDWSFYKQDIAKIITELQELFYRMKQKELLQEIEQIERELNKKTDISIKKLNDISIKYLRNILYDKYGRRACRKVFSEEDLWKSSEEVLMEYPIVLSTAFSSKSSLNQNIVYDYVIMDEASQIDVVTGALALSCAKNAVIVGDIKQLPNVITSDMEKQTRAIFETFEINEGYNFCDNSFLQSILKIMQNVPQTLLREHYRCHPKIINFCNQKFYGGNLIIMTEDKGEEDVLNVIKTVKGNHERKHYSQRQIDIIKKEVLNQNSERSDNIGIIAPYNNQVNALKKEFLSYEIATVHKFQGREKDTIIISTVDDKISDFIDDPNFLNVAVSRAKEHLWIVVSGNEQEKKGNISDLISYIQYNNFQIVNSKVYSVFDYLYKQYTTCRLEYLKKHTRISKYDSENLMYGMICDLIGKEPYDIFEIICHQSLRMLIRDTNLLNDRERSYVMHHSAHVDFLIYNRVSKNPVLAIEVDGYAFHKEGTAQAVRDKIKNHIFDLYHIPFLRFMTNGSEEKERLLAKLDEIIREQKE